MDNNIFSLLPVHGSGNAVFVTNLKGWECSKQSYLFEHRIGPNQLTIKDPERLRQPNPSLRKQNKN
jgi:hypothetical protein